jgi:hypothetical protein
MPSLEQRLTALEGGKRNGQCLECELDRLNCEVSGIRPLIKRVCSHRAGHTLFDALRALNTAEIRQ